MRAQRAFGSTLDSWARLSRHLGRKDGSSLPRTTSGSSAALQPALNGDEVIGGAGHSGDLGAGWALLVSEYDANWRGNRRDRPSGEDA